MPSRQFLSANTFNFPTPARSPLHKQLGAVNEVANSNNRNHLTAIIRVAALAFLFQTRPMQIRFIRSLLKKNASPFITSRVGFIDRLNLDH
jgi:hypothetical protein